MRSRSAQPTLGGGTVPSLIRGVRYRRGREGRYPAPPAWADLQESLKFDLLAHWKLSIQIKIEFEHVYPRFAEEAKLPSLSMLCRDSANLIDRYPPRLGYARQLKLG